MTSRLSLFSLLITCITFGFLVLEWFTPSSSLVLLIAMIVLSIIGFVCSVLGVRKGQNALSIAAVILGFIAMGLMLLIFSIMFIMGLGA